MEIYILKYPPSITPYHVTHSARREAVDVKCADFDDVLYHITTHGESYNILQLSIKMRIFEDLRNFGAEAILEDEYKGMVTDTEAGYDLSIKVDLDSLPDKPEVIAKKFSELKRNIVGAPFTQCFNCLLDGSTGELPPIRIDYRERETIYIVPGKLLLSFACVLYKAFISYVVYHVFYSFLLQVNQT
jgi:hypothetical protein